MELQNWVIRWIALLLFYIHLSCCSCSKLTEPRKDPKPSYVTVMTSGTYRSAPDFITENGIKVWVNKAPVTRVMMEDAADFFAIYMFNEAGVPLYFTSDLLKNFTVEWTTDLLALGNHPAGSVGGVKVGREITVLWTGKLSSSSLFHEWLHGVLLATEREADPDHKDRWWDEILPGMKEKAAADGL